jgi:hypothetical protein
MRVNLAKITLFAAFEPSDGLLPGVEDSRLETLADDAAEMLRNAGALTVASEYESAEADITETEDGDELLDALVERFPTLTNPELDDLIDLLQRMIDGEPTNPDVTAWLPVLAKFQAQRQATGENA